MFRKALTASALFALLGSGPALAQECPPDCPVKGGGPASTDCILELDPGVGAKVPGGRVVECRDADPACDKNPLPGVCGFEVKACLNNADPSLPTCTANGVDSVRVRGGGEAGRDIADAIDALLPTSDNQCTDVTVDVGIAAEGTTEPLGQRHFSLGATSSFMIGGIPLGNFTGSIDLSASAVDPATGLALVDITSTSEYIVASLSGFGFLCLKPVPVQAAGVIACGKRRDGGKAMRIVAGNETVKDRDGLLLRCTTDLNYTTSITIDRNLGVVGEEGFTEEDCTAAGGTVTEETGICVSGFQAGQLDETTDESGEMLIAPFAGLNGFPVEISQQTQLPCTGGGNGMSAAIALTTQRSEANVIDVNNIPGAVLNGGISGEPFDCDDFATENGPGVLVFAAPQLNLPVFGDAITQFRFSDR